MVGRSIVSSGSVTMIYIGKKQVLSALIGFPAFLS